MTENSELYEQVRSLVLNDPAVQAAADQLRTAEARGADPHPAMTRAFNLIADTILQRAIEVLEIPAEIVPYAILAMSRSLRRQFGLEDPAHD